MVSDTTPPAAGIEPGCPQGGREGCRVARRRPWEPPQPAGSPPAHRGQPVKARPPPYSHPNPMRPPQSLGMPQKSNAHGTSPKPSQFSNESSKPTAQLRLNPFFPSNQWLRQTSIKAYHARPSTTFPLVSIHTSRQAGPAVPANARFHCGAILGHCRNTARKVL